MRLIAVRLAPIVSVVQADRAAPPAGPLSQQRVPVGELGHSCVALDPGKHGACGPGAEAKPDVSLGCAG
jgi:hypothetical protein